MIQQSHQFVLHEWESLSPSVCPKLRDVFLDETKESERVVKALAAKRMLRLTELRTGLEISAFSHVGRIQVGGLTITVLPKLRGPSLLRLLRYAFGFRKLEFISRTSHSIDESGFEDLLVSQLNAEAEELISRGLQRSYVRTDERLASPRGRIDINRFATDGGTLSATLPCRHFPRSEDTLLNRVLMAGLSVAAQIASSVELSRASRRLASLLVDRVTETQIDSAVMEQVRRESNRLTAAYEPALSIIELLIENQGVVLKGREHGATLSGFLFDMNRFFQALLGRFLQENLMGLTVRDEHGLKGMMRYDTAFNPRGRRSPTPRPDYAVLRRGKVLTLLDAKYRDLWNTSLPREMLYQLVVYAVSQPENPVSTILYPCLDPSAREAKINVEHPMDGEHIGQVSLRPVDLLHVESLVSDSTKQAERESYANYLAFGS